MSDDSNMLKYATRHTRYQRPVSRRWLWAPVGVLFAVGLLAVWDYGPRVVELDVQSGMYRNRTYFLGIVVGSSTRPSPWALLGGTAVVSTGPADWRHVSSDTGITGPCCHYTKFTAALWSARDIADMQQYGVLKQEQCIAIKDTFFRLLQTNTSPFLASDFALDIRKVGRIEDPNECRDQVSAVIAAYASP